MYQKRKKLGEKEEKEEKEERKKDVEELMARPEHHDHAGDPTIP